MVGDEVWLLLISKRLSLKTRQSSTENVFFLRFVLGMSKDSRERFEKDLRRLYLSCLISPHNKWNDLWKFSVTFFETTAHSKRNKVQLILKKSNVSQNLGTPSLYSSAHVKRVAENQRLWKPATTYSCWEPSYTFSSTTTLHHTHDERNRERSISVTMETQPLAHQYRETETIASESGYLKLVLYSVFLLLAI